MASMSSVGGIVLAHACTRAPPAPTEPPHYNHDPPSRPGEAGLRDAQLLTAPREGCVSVSARCRLRLAAGCCTGGTSCSARTGGPCSSGTPSHRASCSCSCRPGCPRRGRTARTPRGRRPPASSCPCPPASAWRTSGTRRSGRRRCRRSSGRSSLRAACRFASCPRRRLRSSRRPHRKHLHSHRRGPGSPRLPTTGSAARSAGTSCSGRTGSRHSLHSSSPRGARSGWSAPCSRRLPAPCSRRPLSSRRPHRSPHRIGHGPGSPRLPTSGPAARSAGRSCCGRTGGRRTSRTTSPPAGSRTAGGRRRRRRRLRRLRRLSGALPAGWEKQGLPQKKKSRRRAQRAAAAEEGLNCRGGALGERGAGGSSAPSGVAR
mmetsp:Transcript_10197/g.28751  ORF Transcript_10197/g.28751 Transcript_10197/m.28751 type:complete len:374 (+) Transcript_10197:172-1293(+)